MKAKKYTKETIANIGVFDRSFPDFKIGDCIQVGQRLKEGDKGERIQIFEGDVIAIKNRGISKTFTVRRIEVNNVGVERIFPYYSPGIAFIKFIGEGDIAGRAKLYYMRNRIGKAARVPKKQTKRVVEIEAETIVE